MIKGGSGFICLNDKRRSERGVKGEEREEEEERVTEMTICGLQSLKYLLSGSLQKIL